MPFLLLYGLCSHSVDVLPGAEFDSCIQIRNSFIYERLNQRLVLKKRICVGGEFYEETRFGRS